MQVLLNIQYDGTNYSGFQRQQNAMTIQEKLEDALLLVFGQKIRVVAASRTDAGVHALGQRAAFFVERMSMPIDKLPYILNANLPPDITVVGSQEVPESFNPRFDAKFKRYVYTLYNAPFSNPLLRRYSVLITRQVDTQAMAEAANHFVGKHDFAAFCATGGSQKTTVREVFNCECAGTPEGLVTLSITGSGFLYNMVRIIAGTLYYVGIGRISASAIPEIILSKNRKLAGKTMPPHGLVLVEVGY